jgi:hypothetical protein
MRVMSAIVAVAVLSVVSPAFAGTTWTCISKPVDADVPSITDTFVEVDAKTLNVGINDISGQPTLYEIVENTGEGIIAVAHSSGSPEAGKPVEMLLSMVLLNRKTGELRMYGMLLRTAYVDTYRGQCVGEKRP